MSFYMRRSARQDSDAMPGRIEFGIAPNTPLAQVVEMVAQGSVARRAAASALRRDRVVSLALKGTSIGESVARMLEEYLAACTCVRISLDSVSFSSNDAFLRFCNGVSQNNRLERVDITSCKLSDSQADDLAVALTTSRESLTDVDLSHNALASPTLCIERLKELTSLRRLNLSGNQLLCVETLAGAVSGRWPALLELRLVRTGMSEEDAEVLAEAAASGRARFREYTDPGVESRVILLT